ncbi:hypothetical protein AX14_007165 [Amanita brunnescens Koide BX004]|nr:hypothetical protein AX14_007165 [Amanita brunnescens Koide BX004]
MLQPWQLDVWRYVLPKIVLHPQRFQLWRVMEEGRKELSGMSFSNDPLRVSLLRLEVWKHCSGVRQYQVQLRPDGIQRIVLEGNRIRQG